MSTLKRGKILVVDDERGMCHILKRLLSDQGYKVDTAGSGEIALKLIEEEEYDAALVDIRMPGIDGLMLLSRIHEHSKDTSVIMMTAYGTIEDAVTAMKKGAYEFITKPFNNDEVLAIVSNAVERKRLLDRNRLLSKELEQRNQLEGLVGNSRPMQELYNLIEKVAPTDSTVLILGESGTGKELVARAIHNQSQRKDENYVAVNCGALPRELIESELFGHEKGSFSGAHQRKIGLIESADGGSIFLDEIGDLPLELQVKILRVLEQKEIRRIGSVNAKQVDVRIIAATNRDLNKDIEKGTFREDLYYRLSIMDIRLPPLRERKEDIPLLVDHFIARFNQKMNRSVEGFEPEALRILMEASWNGNVRQLENMIQRCMIMREDGIIQVGDLPKDLTTETTRPGNGFIDPSRVPLQKARELFEKEYLSQLLEANEYNVTQSALNAGISRRHLQELIKKYDLRAESNEKE